jgi:hypothetical protein
VKTATANEKRISDRRGVSGGPIAEQDQAQQGSRRSVVGLGLRRAGR